MTSSARPDTKDAGAKGQSLTIRYHRPEAPWSMVKMTVPNDEEAQIQTARLQALGYRVMDVT